MQEQNIKVEQEEDFIVKEEDIKIEEPAVEESWTELQGQSDKLEQEESVIVKEEEIKIEEPALQESWMEVKREDLIIEQDYIKIEQQALERQDIKVEEVAEPSSCRYCRIVLLNEELQKDHKTNCPALLQMGSSNVSELFKCEHCKCTFIDKERWQVHEKWQCSRKPTNSKKPADILQCDLCEFKSNHKSKLKRHIALIHKKGIAKWFKCDKCPYQTVHKSHMTAHKLVHSDTYPCACPLCRKSFRQKRGLDNHLLNKHINEYEKVRQFISSKVYECNVCDQFRTVKKSKFSDHLEKMHLTGTGGRTKHSCPHCGYRTFYKSSLKRHLLTHSSAKPHVCIVCHKGFAQKVYLDGHIMSQHKTNEQLLNTITCKVHECSKCPFKTVYKGDMNKHQLVHSDTSTCVCSLCQKSFRQKIKLHDHLLHKHSSEFEKLRPLISSKVYECNVCNQFRTVFKSKFSQHLELVHLEGASGCTKHSCPHCDYSTFHKSSLNTHLLTHSSVKPHVCTECHKGFVQKLQLDAHIISHHETNEQLLDTITCKVHECSKCPFKTVYKGNMNKHQLVHSDTSTCVCSLCQKSFRQKIKLHDHLLHKHSSEFEKLRPLISSKVYECNVCNQFRTVFKLKFSQHLELVHLEGASGCTKHSCPHCDYSTFYKWHLKSHLLTHSSAKPHVCTECHKGFVQKLQLDGHVISHHETNEQLLKTITCKVHECSKCPYKTMHPSLLKDHHRNKHKN